MSYYNDYLEKTGYFAIGSDTDNMTVIVDPNEFTFEDNNMSDAEVPADSIDLQGKILGVKNNLILKYTMINKEHFKEIYDLTQKKYNDGGDFFMYIRVPLYAENKTVTIHGYFQSKLSMKVTDTTVFKDDDSYKLGGANFDCKYRDVEITFVQK